MDANAYPPHTPTWIYTYTKADSDSYTKADSDGYTEADSYSNAYSHIR